VSQETDKPKTQHLDFNGSSEPMPDRGPRPPTTQLPRPWRLLLQVGSENKTTLGMQIQDVILVGRIDNEEEDEEIDLDLNPYGGYQNGVSRRHARITHEDGTLYIEDLGSTNGTRINGFRLTANQKYRLRDGDEVELGRVRVVMRFVRSSS
jgi:hypothetical protein